MSKNQEHLHFIQMSMRDRDRKALTSEKSGKHNGNGNANESAQFSILDFFVKYYRCAYPVCLLIILINGKLSACNIKVTEIERPDNGVFAIEHHGLGMKNE